MKNVVVVGAGPAGASIAYLLANRGIDVTLVERRRDFAREFRGEILMPSGIEALQQMGLGEALDFFTCGICFGWGTLFNVPDNLNNILLTTSGKQCLYKKQLGQAAGATAAAWPI